MRYKHLPYTAELATATISAIWLWYNIVLHHCQNNPPNKPPSMGWTFADSCILSIICPCFFPYLSCYAVSLTGVGCLRSCHGSNTSHPQRKIDAISKYVEKEDHQENDEYYRGWDMVHDWYCAWKSWNGLMENCWQCNYNKIRVGINMC